VTTIVNVPVDYQTSMHKPLSTTEFIPNRSYASSPYDSPAILSGSTSVYSHVPPTSLYTEVPSTTSNNHSPPLSPLRPSQFSSRALIDQNSGGFLGQPWNGEEASNKETGYPEVQPATVSEHSPPLSPLRRSHFSSRVFDQNSPGLIAQPWNGEEESKQDTGYEVQSTTVSERSPPPQSLQFVQEEDAGRLSLPGGNVVRMPPNYDEAWRPSYL